jgi:dipeptide transport system ATP-binding protein
MEHGPKAVIFGRPRHPYTKALLASTPAVEPLSRGTRISIKGELPSPINPPSGCPFHKRCPFSTELCIANRPEFRLVDERLVACHYAETMH